MRPEDDKSYIPEVDEELGIEFGEKTLLEIDEAGRAFRQVLMDEKGELNLATPKSRTNLKKPRAK